MNATTAPGHDVLLFDGECNICRAGAARLQRMAASPALKMESFRAAGVLSRFPGVTAEACEKAMQYILADGRVVEGFEAVVAALRIRWFGVFLKVYYVPGIRQLLDAGYRLISKYRFKLAGRSCENGACAIHYRRAIEQAQPAPSDRRG